LRKSNAAQSISPDGAGRSSLHAAVDQAGLWGSAVTGGLAGAHAFDRRVLGGTVASALGISALAGDSIGEFEPCFGNKKKTRFIGKRASPF
jgi:hypothetical protein